MKILLKKYLLVKWWIPLLLFTLSVFTFFSNSSLINSDFRFIILFLSGILLLISCIWQLIKGDTLIGIFQLLILIVPTLFLGFMIYLFEELSAKPDSELSTKNIQLIFKEKTDLKLPNNFKILKNRLHHTEGAFDSDYSIHLKIEYNDLDEKSIEEQIVNSKMFDTISVNNSADPLWEIINIKTDKGIWAYKKNGFNFIHCNNKKNQSEPFNIEIDTITNRIELNLFHL